MASQRVLGALLVLLVAAARAQEAEVAVQNVPGPEEQPPGEAAIEVPKQEDPSAAAPEIIEKPAETDPAAPETDPAAPETGPAAPETGPAAPETGPAAPEIDPAAPETGPVAPETGPAAPETDPAAAVGEEEPAPPEVEDPQLAAKKIEGSPEFDETAVFAEPDAIKRVIGAKCQSSNDCAAVTDTDCIDGLCECILGFIPSKHSMAKCLRVPAGLGDECEEEAQCDHAIPNSECRDNHCSCPHNYRFEDGRCWEMRMLGDSCSSLLQCENTEFATCTQGVCTCVDPYIPSPINKCLQPAGDLYKAPCVEDIQCTHSYGDEARCSNNMCRCTNNYHFNGTTCIIDKKLGEVCKTDEDCAVADETSRMCQDSSCTCATGYKTLPGEDICTKSSGEELAVSLTWILCIVVAKYYLA